MNICMQFGLEHPPLSYPGSFEVLFYDGFNKTVQPINVRAMPAKKQAEVQQNILTTREKLTHIKLFPF